MIFHCPVTPDEIYSVKNIFGHKIPYIKVKTSRRQTPPVVSYYVAIPRKNKGVNRRMMIAADVMFVSGLDFVVSVLRGIKFMTVD